MMELLSGPNIVARVGDLGVYTGPFDWNRAFWDDELGIGSLGSYTSVQDTFGYGSNYFVAQLDGTCGVRGKTLHGVIMPDLTGQYGWLMYETGYDQVLGPVGYLYGFDKHSGVYADKLIAKSPGINSAVYPQICTEDRLLSINGWTVSKRALDGSDPGWIEECILTPSPSDPLYSSHQGLPSISRTKTPGVFCIIYPSGGMLFYDVVAKQQVIKPWIPYIGPNNGAWYSIKYDVFISYTITDNTDWYISVWANAPRPDSLSNPEAVGGLVAGRVSQVRVRLLGSNGEPCVGELVSWSISAGDGALTATQSTTDADGYAYIGYVAPITVVTAPTITATVEF